MFSTPTGGNYPVAAPYSVHKCSNQYYWDMAQKRILYKKYDVPYEWSQLDECVNLFKDNSYKEMTITFRDTVDNVERFIEHPSIFVISISQAPLEDVYGNYPTSDWPKGTYRIMKEDGTLTKEEYTNNWVNGLFVRQVQRFFNEDIPLPLDSSAQLYGMLSRQHTNGMLSLIRNSMYGRNGSDYYDHRSKEGRPEYDDIINPDERMYNITFRISSDYFVVTYTMEYKLFEIIQSKFSGINRTYLGCAQFLYALDMLNAVVKSGYYWMKLKRLEKKPAHDFDWSILSHEMGRIAQDLNQNKNGNLNSNFS